MGKGFYAGGKFTLYLAFCDALAGDQNKITAIKTQFNVASTLLSQAAKPLLIGTLNVVICDVASDADFYIWPGSGTPMSYICGLRLPNCRANLYSDGPLSALLGNTLPMPQNTGAKIILHELAHYCLGLYDEYRDAIGKQPAFCASKTKKHCLMETTSDQNIQGFCAGGVHVRGRVGKLTSWQQSATGRSCMEHLTWNYCLGQAPQPVPDYKLPLCQTYPNPKPIIFKKPLPNILKPTVFEKPGFTALPAESRYVLLLDCSASLTPAMLAGLKGGAHFWVNFLADSSDKLALVAYNQEPHVILPLRAFSELETGPILKELATLTPAGHTNLDAALTMGLKQMNSPGYEATVQQIFLLTDGKDNITELPAYRQDELVMAAMTSGSRLQTLGLGPNADAKVLQKLAAGTGGWFTPQPLDAPQTPPTQLAVQSALILQAGMIRGGWGIVGLTEPGQSWGLIEEPVEPGSLGPGIQKFLKGRLPALGDQPILRYQAYVEEDSLQAAIVVSHLTGDEVRCVLVRPDGQVVDPAVDGDVKFCQPAEAPYAFFLVQNPLPGEWTLLLARPMKNQKLPVQVMVFSRHRALAVALDLKRKLFTTEDMVPLKAVGFFQSSPLSDLGKMEAFVKREKAFVGDPWESVDLLPQMTSVDEKGEPLPEPAPLPEGIYMGEVHRDQRGSYPVRVVLQYEGDKGPRFTRVVCQEIHVGPLSPGVNVEGL